MATEFSKKQLEYILEANHRWNVKCGATGAGKTYIDYFYMIPFRIMERKGAKGLNVIMGVTRDTIERNVLQPMRETYGDLVGIINSRNICRMFGENVYCLGAEKVSQVSKIQGSTIKYLYGDEVVKWNEEVFNFVKSRLRTPMSCADLTCNPEHPEHFFKKFLDSDADIYHQRYNIDDNPFYPADTKEELKKEYFGTVSYTRYILGEWQRAEGLVYRIFADDNKRFIIDDAVEYLRATNQQLVRIVFGVDFGGNKSATSFSAVGITRNARNVILLTERYIATPLDPTQLNNEFEVFVRSVTSLYGNGEVYADSAETILIRGLFNTAKAKKLHVTVKYALKKRINDRIMLTCLLMAQDRLKIVKTCTNTIAAFNQAVYDDKVTNEDVRLDDGTSNIDSLDSFEYAIEPYYKELETAGIK